jgi:hypothetical protein
MQLSKMFDSKIQLPWEPGVYKTNAAYGNQLNSYQYWNGVYWGMYVCDKDIAALPAYKDFISAVQNPVWQGLIK